METPRHPIGPAFAKAADATEAWRQQQIAALTDEQRRIFEDARHKAEEREKAKAKDLEKRKQADIQEAIRNRLLAKPRPDLHPRVRGPKLMALLAKRLVTDQLQGTKNPATMSSQSYIERQAERFAIAEVEQTHARELEAIQIQERAKTDELLRKFERARGAELVREDFARAGVADKARTDFQEAARGERLDPLKSEAIARAIAAVKEKEEEEKARDDRDQGRSLSDTFNRTR